MSFSARPLSWSLAFGLIVAALSIIYGLFAVYVRISSDAAIPGWTSLAVLTSFLFGLLFILLGVIGAYLGAIHTQLKGRPRYIVSRYEPGSGHTNDYHRTKKAREHSGDGLRDYR